MFRGELRSDLFQEGVRGTATLEPFFTLPLDINDQKTKWSVNEALEHLTRLETVQDFTNAKTKTIVSFFHCLVLPVSCHAVCMFCMCLTLSYCSRVTLREKQRIEGVVSKGSGFEPF